MKRFLVLALLLVFFTKNTEAQLLGPPMSAFTRSLLTNTTAPFWRSALGLASTGTNVLVTNNVVANGTFSGNGNGLTNLNASANGLAIAANTVTPGQLSSQGTTVTNRIIASTNTLWGSTTNWTIGQGYATTNALATVSNTLNGTSANLLIVSNNVTATGLNLSNVIANLGTAAALSSQGTALTNYANTLSANATNFASNYVTSALASYSTSTNSVTPAQLLSTSNSLVAQITNVQVSITGSNFTGAFTGNGAGLTNISATANALASASDLTTAMSAEDGKIVNATNNLVTQPQLTSFGATMTNSFTAFITPMTPPPGGTLLASNFLQSLTNQLTTLGMATTNMPAFISTNDFIASVQTEVLNMGTSLTNYVSGVQQSDMNYAAQQANTAVTQMTNTLVPTLMPISYTNTLAPKTNATMVGLSATGTFIGNGSGLTNTPFATTNALVASGTATTNYINTQVQNTLNQVNTNVAAFLYMATTNAPATYNAVGVPGTMAWSTDGTNVFLYLCGTTNRWGRQTLTTNWP